MMMYSMDSSDHNHQSLIPGLPNDISSLILSLYIPFSHHSRLRSISKLWNQFFNSKTPFSIRFTHSSNNNSLLSQLLCIFPEDPTISSFYIYDPLNLAWCSLPPMPCNPYVYGLCNFQAVGYGDQIYVIGGSVFDTRSYPLDRPSPSGTTFRFDLVTKKWEGLSNMLSPRGSFACASFGGLGLGNGGIVVAGGGSRHTMFGAAGSSMSSVEMFDIGRNEWVALDGLPGFRAGCVGFMVGEDEFWVMGGYGESRTVWGVFPVDDYYRDAVVMDLKNGGTGKWRELGDMWEEGERRRLGRIAVIEDVNKGSPAVFMLDDSDIFRYDMASNRWKKEASIPKKLTDESPAGFVALNGELYVMGSISGGDSTENRKSRQHKRSASLFLQIYHPQKMTWRTLITKLPFQHSLDFKTAVMCTIRL
uniref:F-box/kelch-repeat protein OR23-like n=1 Tax=Erigeron canadensis TaxID=72917 RepID=UPI001CB911B1|nr:F-box/kelch-repeat protein OR23-like [Erigeron canadensis]